MADRREFLKAMGVATPAFLIADEALAEQRYQGGLLRGSPANVPITPIEAFELYVETSLRSLSASLPYGISDVLRSVIEAQGAGLAAVLMRMQGGIGNANG